MVGHQKEHPACKNRVMMCWCGYLSAVRCKLFAYGPADATAIPKCHHLLPHLDPDWLSQLFLENRPLNWCSSSSSSSNTCWVVCSDAAAGRKGEISVARVSETDYATLSTWFRVGISAFFAAIFLLQRMHLTWKTDIWTFVQHFAWHGCRTVLRRYRSFLYLDRFQRYGVLKNVQLFGFTLYF